MVKVDRVEWVIQPDQSTVLSALQTGEVDFVERPALDLLPLLSHNPNIRVQQLNPSATRRCYARITCNRRSTMSVPGRR